MVSEVSARSVRRATLADVEFLVALRNQLAVHFLNPRPATVEKTMELLADSQTWMLELDGRRAGTFALYKFDGHAMEFGRFMIAPEYQYRGLGKLALETAIAEAKELGTKRLHLLVKDNSSAAIHLYIRFGFSIKAWDGDGPVEMELELV